MWNPKKKCIYKKQKNFIFISINDEFLSFFIENSLVSAFFFLNKSSYIKNEVILKYIFEILS